jgi:hypothetical protein
LARPFVFTLGLASVSLASVALASLGAACGGAPGGEPDGPQQPTLVALPPEPAPTEAPEPPGTRDPAAGGICTPRVRAACELNQVVWYNSCGIRHAPTQPCGSGERCVEDEAGARCEPDCGDPGGDLVCTGGDVYREGRCGARGTLVERCPTAGPCVEAEGGAACSCSEAGIASVCGGPDGAAVVQGDSCGIERVIERCAGADGCVEGPEGAGCDCDTSGVVACVSIAASSYHGDARPDRWLRVRFDGCGRSLGVEEACLAGATCEADGAGGVRCDCAPDVGQACDGDARVFSVDACGQPGALLEVCSGGARCVERGAAAACECTTTARDALTCDGGDVYYADSCGGPTASRARSCNSAPCVQLGEDADCGGVVVDVTPAEPAPSEGPDDVLVPNGSRLYLQWMQFDMSFRLADGGAWPTGRCTLQVGGRDPADRMVYRAINTTGVFQVTPFESQAEFEAAACGDRRAYFLSCEDAAGRQRHASTPITLEKRCR